MNPPDEVLTVMRALCRYLSDNPQACDTPAGIARWWLRGEHAPVLVEAALQQLHGEGRLERLPAADGRVRYRWRDEPAAHRAGRSS
jgi:hypothetical protein